MKTAFALVLALMISACGGAEKEDPPPDLPLFNEDREALRSSEWLLPEDEESHAFELVFGGLTSGHVDEFIGKRVKHLITASEKLGDFFDVPAPGIESASGEERRKLAAINAGAFVWLQRFDRDSPSYGRRAYFKSRSGRKIPVDSPSIGVVQLGDMYARSVNNSRDEPIELPWELRIAILVHEGRHSDCQNPREINRVASSGNFQSQISSLECGHPHAHCPEGHDYAGIPACDSARDRLGPYSVQALFLKAALERPGISHRDRNFLRSQYIDARSRISSGYESVIRRTAAR